LRGIGLALSLLAAIPSTQAQRETERYIPIGQSPGLSQRQTTIAEIAEVDARAQTITVTDPAGRRTLKIGPTTRIWLDRSKLKRTNLTGSFADLRTGRRVEVKYTDPSGGEFADWVKVEVTEP
jgi:hypothetical protein